MPTYSFYDPETGIFIDRHKSCSARLIERNTPPGTVAIEGQYNCLTQRVDLATGQVVPRTAQETSSRARSWGEIRDRIQALERRQQRALRELVLDPANTEARRQLETIEAQIAELRGELAGGPAIA